METKYNGGDLYDIASERVPKSTKEAFEDACEDIYHAIRNTFGYGDTADYLIDWVCDMADAWELNNKQKLA